MRAFAVAGWLLTGCFSLDPIVPRPGVTIGHEAPPNDVAYRGSELMLEANFDNPRPSHGRYDWLVLACHVPDGGDEICDDNEFYTGSDALAKIPVPVTTMAFPPTLVNRLKVKLQGHDDRGAIASAEENIAVNDGLPTIDVGGIKPSYSVGEPVDLIAKYGDPDDPLDSLTLLLPEVIGPSAQSSYTLEALPSAVDPTDPKHITGGTRLTPGELGMWTVAVGVRDPAGVTTSAGLPTFMVHPDQPPCLAQWEPIAPPSGTTLPIFEPTVFQIPLVRDDLDAYPRRSSASQFGTTRFVWSILRPGASGREVLADANGSVGNHVDFDPAAFTPGDVVELRVEIFDRHNTALPCADSAATCSITADLQCSQRQTWRIEVR